MCFEINRKDRNESLSQRKTQQKRLILVVVRIMTNFQNGDKVITKSLIVYSIILVYITINCIIHNV